MAEIIEWLRRQHREIMGCEHSAMKLLEQDDMQGYLKAIREKAELLASLAERAMPELASLPEAQKREIETGLKRFSSSAQTAISLNSPFYMAALLYRDDHKNGEPDNLELFIRDLAQNSH